MERTSIHRLEHFLNGVWSRARQDLLAYLTRTAGDALQFFDADDVANLDVAPQIVNPSPLHAPLALDGFGGWTSPNELPSVRSGNDRIAAVHRELADHAHVDERVRIDDGGGGGGGGGGAAMGRTGRPQLHEPFRQAAAEQIERCVVRCCLF